MVQSGARRVLVVDDETLIVMLIEAMLEELGCEVVGPAYDLAEGLALAREADADCAILDVNLSGQPINPIAQALRARGVPFAFASGYAPADLASEFPGAPVLMKPFSVGQVSAVLDVIARGHGAPLAP